MRRWHSWTLRSVRAVVGGDGQSSLTPVPFSLRLCGDGDRARARAPPAASWGWQRGLADSAPTPQDVGLLAKEPDTPYSPGAKAGIVRTWLVDKVFECYKRRHAMRLLNEERMNSRQLTDLIAQVPVPMPRPVCTVSHEGKGWKVPVDKLCPRAYGEGKLGKVGSIEVTSVYADTLL